MEDQKTINNTTKRHVGRLVELCHGAAKTAGWWTNVQTGEPLEPDVPLKLCLIHSEVSEALEADRKNVYDDKLPHRKGVEVELVDACIRIFDLAGALGLDLGGAIAEKMEYNSKRLDHKIENRKGKGGKRY
jgi:NTP pyrophosphatase (non-canonical NTP hydrolase)